MEKKILACAITLAYLGVAGCSGSSNDNSPEADEGGEEDTTTFAVAVDDGLDGSSMASVSTPSWSDQLAGFFLNQAWAEPVPQLDPSQFSVTIIGGAEDGSDLTLDPSEFSVRSLGDGNYEVIVPGDPRFDRYIATDVDGDGNTDLRAPTVANDITIDPVSEYVTGILEENEGNFANFNLEEVNSIVDQIRDQVDNNDELRDQIAAAAGDADAIRTLLDEQTTVLDQFEVAALPDPDNLDTLPGNYQLLGQGPGLERTFFTEDGSETRSDGGELSLELLHFPIELTRNEDSVDFSYSSETTFDASLEFTSPTSSGLFFDNNESDDEDGSLSGSLTSLGFNMSVGGEGPQDDGDGTLTQAKSTLSFVDVSGSFEGFVSVSQQKFEFEETNEDGTFEATERWYPWIVVAKERSSFDPSVLAGDWGLVLENTSIFPDGTVDNRAEALNIAIDSSGIFNFDAQEEFTFGFSTSVRDSSTFDSFGSFNLVTGDPESIAMNYAADGSFSFNDPEATTFASKGVVFEGNQMLALGLLSQLDAQDASADEAGGTMLFAVPKAEAPQAALEGKGFQLTGRSYVSTDTDVEIARFGPVSLTFNADATLADLKGAVTAFIVNTPADGEARQLSETFSLSDFDVSISPEGMVQAGLTDSSGTLALNGFVSEDGQNLVLAFAVDDGDAGDTGVFVGRCVKNCQ